MDPVRKISFGDKSEPNISARLGIRSYEHTAIWMHVEAEIC